MRTSALALLLSSTALAACTAADEAPAGPGSDDASALAAEAVGERSDALVATFVVNTTDDKPDGDPGDGKCNVKGLSFKCSLRAAVQEANAKPGTYTIVLEPTTYLLDELGRGEDAGATGDLDLRRDITIKVSGTGRALVRGAAGWDDRIVHVHTGASAKLERIELSGGDVEAAGGGARVEASGALTLFLTDIKSCSATSGGGLFVRPGATLTMNAATISGNTASARGGGLFNLGTVLPSSVTMTDNTAVNEGGGLLNEGVAELSSGTISGNRLLGPPTDNIGGGVSNAGTLRLTNVTVAENVAHSAAGILNDNLSTLTLDRSTVRANVAKVGAGGIINAGTLTVSRTRVAENRGSLGAGLSNAGTLTMTNTAVTHNVSSATGGGLANFGSARLNNVTLRANSAAQQGGGLLNAGVTNDDGNTSAPSIDISNSIVADNAAPQGPDCLASSPLDSLGHNLFENLSLCALAGAGVGDIIGQDPVVVQATPTSNPQLGPGSPALDAGSPALPGSGGDACEAVDLRGAARPADGDGDLVFRCDIGAIETPDFNL
jgi:CSLREA domain-containing protein